MTEVGNFIKQQLVAGFTMNPIDREDLYNYQFSDRLSGTVMPPSPGVESYSLEYQWTGRELGFDLSVKWHDGAIWLAKQVEPWQITHRSRTAVISASPLRVAENLKRINNVREWYDTYFPYILSDSQSYSLYQLVLDKTLKHMRFNQEWIKHYIRQHIGSSLGEGWRWKHTLSMPMDEWKVIYESTRENIEGLKRHAGEYLDIVFKHGSRARSPDMKSFTDRFSGMIERTRIVMFHQYLSLWNAFLPDKQAWYTDVMNDVERMFNVTSTNYYPFKEGGQIYVRASELLTDGYRMVAYDGKAWESSVGLILGQAFSPLMIYMGGISMLPSGIALTSLLGTIASVIVNKHANSSMIILGDDQNHFVKGSLSGIPRVPWIEEQPMDSRTRTILGASFYVPEAPRLTGFKVMSDRADKQLPLVLTGEKQYIRVAPKRDPRERAAWIGMFLGYYGDGTLISRLKKEKINDKDFFAPSETIQDLVSNAREDPFAWAEREGVKKILV